MISYLKTFVIIVLFQIIMYCFYSLVGATITFPSSLVLILLPHGFLTIPLWLGFETIRMRNDE